ncbi:uncharacterized protein BT62DRAFT_936663 [Guyanagaster necrorhizus]|uniref:Uncharacterized protein n=1 Tax=Guyanagaster necrorhizus TaxID=856835 RepID=A0A9P8ANK4_9AGAR|nr:uncharacterized protein BT62DRAFT_936663 [Guyanagaster necrorhizus MCA 3950]KAG7442010.1 hypothetical protein BT62DRAFT_936663 [Guyanagaster necrorhizus MCA 3950]
MRSTAYSRVPRTPPFAKPEYFTRGKYSDWYCNVCTLRLQPKYMSATDALHHENNILHNQNVANVESSLGPPMVDSWDSEMPKQAEMSKDEARDSEYRYFVDHMGEYISYWIRGIEAAKRGEVLKLEDYLDSLDHDGPKDPRGSWGITHQSNTKSRRDDCSSSDDLGSVYASQRKAGKGPKNRVKNKRQEFDGRFTDESYVFVERIAQREEANAKKKE